MVPDGLFDGYMIKDNQDLKEMFQNCISLEYIPDNVFYNLVPLSDIYFTYGLNGFCLQCSSLKKLPKGLMNDLSKYGTINSIYDSFYGCRSITEIPQGFFDSLHFCTNFKSTFWGCSSLEYIPDDLFANCYAITDCTEMFLECSNLRSDKIFYVHVKDDTMDEEVPIFDYVVDPKYKEFREKYGAKTPKFYGMLYRADPEKITWLRSEAEKRGWGDGGDMDPLGGRHLP